MPAAPMQQGEAQTAPPVRLMSASAEARKRAVAAAMDPDNHTADGLLKAFLPSREEQSAAANALSPPSTPRGGGGGIPGSPKRALMGVLHAGGSLLSAAISIGTLGRLGGSGGSGQQQQQQQAQQDAASNAAAFDGGKPDARDSLRAAAKQAAAVAAKLAAAAGTTSQNSTRNPGTHNKTALASSTSTLRLKGRVFAPPALEPPLAPAELNGRRLVVCVTGATGFVAGHIVHRLLAAGHTVRGTCRAPEDDEAVAHLWRLPGAKERLSLHKADLLAPHGAFDAAVAGCDAVVHSASPYVVQNYKKGEEDARIVRPAVHGTESVLGSVERAPTVRRVVLTASTASVFTDPVADVGRGYGGGGEVGLGLGSGGGSGGGGGGGGGGVSGAGMRSRGGGNGNGGVSKGGCGGNTKSSSMGGKADALLVAQGLAGTGDAKWGAADPAASDADAAAILCVFGAASRSNSGAAAASEAQKRRDDADAADRGNHLLRLPDGTAHHAPPGVATERDWNLSADKAALPYFYAKTAAERRAYELEAAQISLRLSGGKQRWTLASINPPAVLGPPLSSRADGESVSQMRDLLSGKLWPCGSPYIGVGACDVRDVAQAHVLAAVLPSAPRGRFLIASVAEGYALHEAALVLRRLYPRRWVPYEAVRSRLLALPFCPMLGLPLAMARAMWAKPVALSTLRAREGLGKGGGRALFGGGGASSAAARVPYLPFEKTVADMAQAMIARGMVPDERPVLVMFAVKAAALAIVLLLAAGLAARLGAF